MKKNTKNIMNNKLLYSIIFIISAFSLFVSLKLFWNQAIYVDEQVTQVSLINGGDFWVSMDWLRLFLLASICLFSLLGLIKSIRNKLD